MVVEFRAPVCPGAFSDLVGDHCWVLVGPALRTDLAQYYLRRTARYAVPPERDR